MLISSYKNLRMSNKASKSNIGLKALGIAALLSINSTVATAAEVPASLKTLSVPEPSNLSSFIRNKSAAIALGKALFWEMRIGSDGEKACATCHFSAGVDNRIKNQLAPAKHRATFDSLANDTLTTASFPFTKFDDITKNDSDSTATLIRDVRDVAGSAGVFSTDFVSATPNADADEEILKADPHFFVPNAEHGDLQVYQVTSRNTPTVINAIFNLRNFWDGRAQTIFNGVNPHGKRDTKAGIYVNKNGVPTFKKITINDASIASLATGPILDTIEMSAAGRVTPDIGKRVLSMRALANQTVSSNDSVLGSLANANGIGLTLNYNKMVKQAFRAKYWKATQPVNMQNGKQYSQMEANFNLFFGLAVQSYIATLVSDDAPFDKFMEGDSLALTPQQGRGLAIFMDKGKCVNCHGGAAFTNAATHRDSTLGTTERISRMIMGNGEEKVYDEGYYNIGVTRTEDDLGLGSTDPFGKPLSFSRLAKIGTSDFYFRELDLPNVSDVRPNERDAVQGSFKVPTLRNVALTAPYFHNGGYGTLRQVVEFYNRGGNFPNNNDNDLAPEISPLGLTEGEIDDLVAFLESLTDERVAKHAAPFDHPSVEVADSFIGDANGVGSMRDEDFPITDAVQAAADIGVEIPAVGAEGYANPSVSVPTFTERLSTP